MGPCCLCKRASPRHFPSSSQPFSHVQAQQRLRSDPSAGRYGHQLVAHQPGHTATPCQQELCYGRPKRTIRGQNHDCWSLFTKHFHQSSTKYHKRLKKTKKKQVLVNLFGSAEKLENTYRAIMSRQVSVSSRWTVFSPSSAWVTAFSSAEPRLQVVVEVCILQEETEKAKQQRKGKRSERKARRLQTYFNMWWVHSETCKLWYTDTERNAEKTYHTTRLLKFVPILHITQHLYTHMHPHVYINNKLIITFSQTHNKHRHTLGHGMSGLIGYNATSLIFLCVNKLCVGGWRDLQCNMIWCSGSHRTAEKPAGRSLMWLIWSQISLLVFTVEWAAPLCIHNNHYSMLYRQIRLKAHLQMLTLVSVRAGETLEWILPPSVNMKATLARCSGLK